MSNQVGIFFVSQRLGRESLLYWENILCSIKQKYINFRVFTAWPEQISSDNSLRTENKIKSIKYFINIGIKGFFVFVPLPDFILNFYKLKPQLIIVNEFNLATIYTVFFRKYLYKSSKILLLVENDPNIGNCKKYPIIRTTIRKWIAKEADKILTNNNLGKVYLESVLNVSLGKIINLPYLTSVPPSNNRSQNENVYDSLYVNFLFIGELTKRKGIEELISAVSRLEGNILKKIKINIVGYGKERTRLINLVNYYKLKDKFIFHGRIAYSDLSIYFRNADCFILPTLYDYRALVGFEALNFCLPLIVSIYDGARNEIVEEGRNGYIVDPLRVESIADAIIKIVSRKMTDDLASFKMTSYEISKQFSVDKCVSNFFYAIDEVLI